MSQLVFDDALAAQLETLYRTRDVLRRRRLVREALKAGPGDRVLDVGCGPGFYVAELLEQVGPTGSVTGVDASPQTLELARRRTEGHGNVALHLADATALPVPDVAFDAALSVQVLEYVADVDAALAELRRALRPGGRAVIWDVDWSTVSWHSTDPVRMARVLAAWDGHLADPALPRTLAARLRAAGFTDVTAEGHTFATTERTPDAYGAAIIPLVEQYVAGRDGITEDEAAAWAAELGELGTRGEFFFACVQFCFTATRPA
jgi:ubiquinone/menaquinone biosynthesis C-methylase UbiE